MSLDNIIKNATRTSSPTPEQEQDDPNFFVDVLASPFRGVEGALQGIYDLADYATGDDLLPDYNRRFLGRSQTFVGSLGEGITQFLTGFIPVAGGLSKVGKLSKITKAGTKALNLKGYAAAGAVADFTVFQAQEERLSNLIEAFPSLSNPVTEYLAADEDDGELEGRFKNTIEGLGIGALTDGLVASLKALKRGRKGDDTTEVLQELEAALFNPARDRALLKDDFDSTDVFQTTLDDAFKKEYGYSIFDAEEGVTALETLRLFNKHVSEEYRPLADALMKNAYTSLGSTRVVFETVTESTPNKLKGSTFSDGVITMRLGGERTFLHELLHASTSKQLHDYLGASDFGDARVKSVNKEFLTKASADESSPLGRLAKSYLKVIKELDADEAVFGRSEDDIRNARIDKSAAYGLNNLDEFISEAFTNPEFRQVLMTIPSETTKNKTMFDDFMDVIKQLFGLSNEQSTLLDDVMSSTDQIIRDQEAKFDYQFNYLQEVDRLRARTEGRPEPTMLTPEEEARYGMGQHRTLDDRGEDFQVEEGKKAPIIEMQEDRLVANRGRTLGKFTFNVGGAYKGKPIEEVPDGYLRKALSWNSVSDGVKARIEKELNARKAGYAPRPFDEYDVHDKVKVSEVTIKKNEALVERYTKQLESDDLKPSTKKELEGKLQQAKKNLEDNKLELASSKLDNRKRISQVKVLKGVKAVKEAEEANQGVSVLRKEGEFHYGNPFSHLDNTRDTIKTANLKETVDNYRAWLEGTDFKDVKQERRKWVLTQIDSGALDGQKLLYYSSQKPNHADVLADFVEKRRSLPSKASPVKAAGRVVNEGMSPYRDAEDYLNTVSRGGAVTPKEAYARYLRNREGKGGKLENNTMRLKEYLENQQITGANKPTNLKNPRIQGKSQRSSDLELSKSRKVLGQREIDDVIEDGINNLANTLEAGGDKAIRSAGKNIRTTTQALAVVQAIARNLEKAPKAEKHTVESLTQETEETVKLLGGNKNSYLANLRKMNAEGIDLGHYRAVQTATKKLIDVMSADVVDVANKIKEANVNPELNKRQLEVELLSTLDQLHEVQRLWSLMGREAGLTLVQRKFLTAPEGKYRVNENIGFDPKAAKPSDYDKYVNEARTGSMSIDRMVKLLAGAKTAKDANARIQQVAGLNKEMKGSKSMDIIMEYWMNSLLSGPTTQIVNLLGNSLTFTMRALEQTSGALLTGDMELAKATLRYTFSMETIADAWKLATKTLKTTEATLTQGSRVFDDKLAQSKVIASEGSGAIATAINALGTVVRLPSRGLMAGDEFFKQLNYRTYVKSNLAYEAMKKGAKSGGEVAEYVQKNFDNFLTKGARAYNEHNIYLDAVAAAKAKGLTFGTEQQQFIKDYLENNKFDETRGGLADAALGFAEENTFTNDLADEGFIGTLSNTLNKLKNKGGMWSTLNFVVPFLRTPTNILKFSLDRTPFGMMPELVLNKKRKALTDALMSEDPFVRAQTLGRLATATTAVSAGLYYVMQNKEFITGGGPPNKDQLENLRMSGWRPYSIKIGDTYYSYQRLDPIATMLGLFADIVEGHHYHELEGLPIQDMTAIAIMSLTNNVTNKSYVKGLDTLFDLVRDPVGNFGPFAGNIAGGFAPTILSQAQNMADERELKETRAIFDYFLKKMPNNNLPTRRNFLGEAMVNKNSPYMTGIINPVYFNPESDDIVDHELSKLQYGFTRPSTKLFGALEMRDVYNEEGRQAYDRFLELTGTTKIGGQTLRQQLRKLVKNKAYQDAPAESARDIGEISPRVKAVQRLLRVYRRQAKSEMLKEFPDLQQAISQLQQDKQQYRTF